MRPRRESQEGQGERGTGANGWRRISWPLRNYHRDGAQLVETLKKYNTIAELLAYVTGPWESPLLFKGILNKMDPQMT